MTTHKIGVIMNGVTGRMGSRQHLARSILAIRAQGGVKLDDGRTVVPEPILVGRDERKLKCLCDEHGLEAYSTELDTVLSDARYGVYFDSVTTPLRPANLRRAIAAGKHVYAEKPTAMTSDDAIALARQAEAAGVKHGVVQDMLWLPGLLKLKSVLESGFLGEILSVRGEFGYWVFDGFERACQRPSWNYRRQDGGGILLDMFCHWRYVIAALFGEVRSLVAHGATHVKRRVDEQDREYECTADDAAYAIFLLDGGLPVQFNSSWCVRVRRDDLLTLQVDGTRGSAVAGLRTCRVQHETFTPRAVWDPDVDQPIDFHADWEEVASKGVYENAFKHQWERFLMHVVRDTPFPWNLLEGARGVQLAELGLRSWKERRWIDVPELV